MIDSELENINLRIQNKEPESSAEFIIRETRALFKKPLVLFAGGKDSLGRDITIATPSKYVKEYLRYELP